MNFYSRQLVTWAGAAILSVFIIYVNYARASLSTPQFVLLYAFGFVFVLLTLFLVRRLVFHLARNAPQPPDAQAVKNIRARKLYFRMIGQIQGSILAISISVLLITLNCLIDALKLSKLETHNVPEIAVLFIVGTFLGILSQITRAKIAEQ